MASGESEGRQGVARRRAWGASCDLNGLLNCYTNALYSDSGFGDTLTPGAGFTQRANVAPASDVELLVQDKLIPAGATVTSSTGTGANTTWEAAVVVFTPATTTSTPPPASGAGAVSTFTRNPQGAQTSVSYALPGARTLSDTVTRSQAGRVMTDLGVKDGATTSGWAYTYDSAGRLTQGVLAANGPTPAVTYGYGYAPGGGCGADPGSGLDGARTSSTVKVGATAATTTTSCTDYASRVTSTTGGGVMVYNTHGDATTIGTQSFTYDSSDRVAAGSAGGTNQTVTYTLDATGRTVTRTGTGTAPGVDTSTTVYSYTGAGDTADLQLTAANTISERYLALPGGVLYTKRYATTGGDIWALPNLHGDTLTTTNTTGTPTGTPAIYDPYGNPLAPTTGLLDLTTDPTTRTGGLTDGWVGSHQRGTEHTGTANWTLMGARTYLPGYGQFTTTDPSYAGNTNPYAYPQDPINGYDLNGQCSKYRKVGGRCPDVGANVNSWVNRQFVRAVSGAAKRYSIRTGGSCGMNSGMMVCQGGWGHAYFNGGTTFGNTYLAGPGDQSVSPETIGHEKVHMRQWNTFGVMFPRLYFLQGLVGVNNSFEREAGLCSGNYIPKPCHD
ncbi:MAG: hypothetical protein ACOH17_12805 [Cellulomonas sp.]